MWDEFEDSREDCNGVRPSSLPATQLYCVVILPHAGADLESYRFQGKMVWREACQVFWQVAKALKVAEEVASFEVCKQSFESRNDLLTFCSSIAICTGVRSFCKKMSSQQPKRTQQLYNRPSKRPSSTLVYQEWKSMAQYTIHRLTKRYSTDRVSFHLETLRLVVMVSRMKLILTESYGIMYRGFNTRLSVRRLSHDARTQPEPLGGFQPIDERDCAYHSARPLYHNTQKRLQWLHYLVKKLLHSKGLRKPPTKRNVEPPPPPSPEHEAWQSLITVEALLAQSIGSLTMAVTAASSKKGRRKGKGGTATGGSASTSTTIPSFSCAGSVVDEGLKWGLCTM